MSELKKKDLIPTTSVLLFFSGLAYVVNILVDYNYMFLMNHDGTPYQLVWNLVAGHPVLYPISVVVLFIIYILAFYAVYSAVDKKHKKKKALKETKEPVQIG